MEKVIDNFEVYWKDELVSRVVIDGNKVHVDRVSKDYLKQIFYTEEITLYELSEILGGRCWERTRADIDSILAHLGVKEYNVFEIIKKTHGKSYNDFLWIKFEGENYTYKDMKVDR